MVKALALCLPVFFAIASCSDSKLVDMNGDGIDDGIVAPNNVTIVTPTKPIGFVAGQVIHAITNQPISGATVTLFGGGVGGTVMTDSTGGFTFGPISAGAGFALRVDASGFADATISGLMIDDAAGNFPTSNSALFVGPIELIPSDGAFTVQVVSSDGGPVMNAEVTIETAVRYFLNDVPRSSAVASAMTDADGLAKIMNMLDVRSFPPGLERHAALVVNVAPIDTNNDNVADLRGATVELTGADVLHGGAPPLIVLEPPSNRRLQIVASNVAELAHPNGPPSLLATNDNIRVVFNEPIDRESVLIDLRDELGTATIQAPFVIGVVGNTLSIDPASDLEPGKEYNIAIRAASPGLGVPQSFSGAAPFFAKIDPNVPIGITGRFRDLNGDLAWGNANDVIEMTVSIPIGRANQSPAFRVKAWFGIDLNGTVTLGDAQGELPPSGSAYPAPIILSAAEPAAPNGARASGYTRYFAQLPVALPSPLSQIAGGVAFEVRIDPEDNDGLFVTDASGRIAPARTTGTALLQ